MTRRLMVTTLALAAGLAACSSDSTGNNDGGGTESAWISATVGGASFVAVEGLAASYVSNALVVSGYNTGQAAWLAFTVINVSQTGTYQFPGSNAVGTLAEYEIVNGGSGQWITGYNGGSGSVTISTLTAHSASGTFSFTGALVPGSGGTDSTKAVTNGKFNVTY